MWLGGSADLGSVEPFGGAVRTDRKKVSYAFGDSRYCGR